MREQYLFLYNCIFLLLCLLAVNLSAVAFLASLVLVALFLASFVALLVTSLVAVLVTLFVALLITCLVTRLVACLITSLVASGITRSLACLSGLVASSTISAIRALCRSALCGLLVIVASARCSSEHCSHYCQ